jgi:hypothetical protein
MFQRVCDAHTHALAHAHDPGLLEYAFSEHFLLEKVAFTMVTYCADSGCQTIARLEKASN